MSLTFGNTQSFVHFGTIQSILMQHALPSTISFIVCQYVEKNLWDYPNSMLMELDQRQVAKGIQLGAWHVYATQSCIPRPLGFDWHGHVVNIYTITNNYCISVEKTDQDGVRQYVKDCFVPSLDIL